MTLGLEIVARSKLFGSGVVAKPKRFGSSKYLGFDMVVKSKSLEFGTKKNKGPRDWT
jgi:hypothetical protein